MKRLLAVGAVSAATTFAVAPAVRDVMERMGTLDVPNHRSSHATPTPRGGGIAALAGALVGTLVAGERRPQARVGLPVLALAAVGFADDHFGGLAALPRLAAQVLAGTGAAIGEPVHLAPMAALTMSGVVNVTNFMDGINGITALTAITWGLNASTTASQPEVAVLGALCAGSALGFLPWNAPSAQLFLGDVGSYFFGSVMASGIIRSLGATQPIREALAVGAPLLLYLADAAQAIRRRRQAGQPLTEAHREHVYQRVVDAGALTHTQMAALHAALAGCCAAAWRIFSPHRAAAVSAALVMAYLDLPRALVGMERT